MAGTMEKAFAEVGMTPKARKPRPQKVQTCRKCGSTMTIVEGTNVMVCEDKSEVGCNNRVIFSITR